MRHKRNIYEELLLLGVPKQMLHTLFHKVILAQLATRNKRKRAFFTRVRHFIYFNLYPYKTLAALTRIRGVALALLKTQFAKKPKNPV